MRLIDSVSGHILAAQSHKSASGPVLAVRHENWLIYTFWNTFVGAWVWWLAWEGGGGLLRSCRDVMLPTFLAREYSPAAPSYVLLRATLLRLCFCVCYG